MLDYLITVHLYNKYPGMSPGMLTDLRSASVNNDCYAQSAVKVELHKHILHGSQDLHRHIVTTVLNFDMLSLESTFGWESETTFPKVSVLWLVVNVWMHKFCFQLFVIKGSNSMFRMFYSIQVATNLFIEG